MNLKQHTTHKVLQSQQTLRLPQTQCHVGQVVHGSQLRRVTQAMMLVECHAFKRHTSKYLCTTVRLRSCKYLQA